MKRLFQDIRKYRWYLLVGLGVLASARYAYSYGKPRSVFDLQTSVRMIRNGEAYQVKVGPGADDIQLLKVSTHSGNRTVIAREKMFQRDVRAISVYKDSIYYVLADHPPPVAIFPGRITRGSSAPTNVVAPPPLRPHILRALPEAGGEPKTVPIEFGNASFAIVNGTIFWVDTRQASALQTPPAPGAPPILDCDLVASPIAGGSERRYAKMVSRRTRLTGTSSAVYWTTPNQAKQMDLYRMEEGAEKPFVLKDFPGKMPITELGGRLYWIEDTFAKGTNKGAADSAVVSVSKNGSDRQVVYHITSNRTMFGEPTVGVTQVNANEGKLYVLVSATVDRTMASSARPARLSRYTPGRPGLEKVYDFNDHGPDTVFFDEGFYYYAVVEVRENMFDLSPAGLYVSRVPVLYRFHLPG